MPDTDLERGLGLRLVRNMGMQSGLQVATIMIGAVTMYVLARALDPESMGGFIYLFSFMYFFLALNDLGTSLTLAREISQTPSRMVELVQNVLGLRLAMAIVLVLVGWIVVALLPLPAAYKLSLRVFLCILPIQAFATPAVILYARLEIGRSAIVELANRLTGFTLMMLSVWAGHGLLFITLSLLCGEVAGAVAAGLMTRRDVTPRPRFDRAVWIAMMRMSLPLSGNGLLSAFLNRFDSLLLQALGNLTQVAYYGLAYRLPNLFERVPQLAMSTLFPIMSRLAVSNPLALRRLYRKMLAVLVILVVPMLVVVVWLSNYIVRAWFGPEYEGVAPLLRVVILSTAVLYVSISGGYLLIALSRPQANLYAMAAAAGVNVILNFLWIPRYGALGAAWATVAGFAVLSIATLCLAEIALVRAVHRHTVGAP
jgi:O-antigen/teichoic acid export membrane protein